MIRWLRSKVRKAKAKPNPGSWIYVGHDYCGLSNRQTHVYLVRFIRGDERSSATFEFHAKHPTPQNDEKMAEHFRQQAARKV